MHSDNGRKKTEVIYPESHVRRTKFPPVRGLVASLQEVSSGLCSTLVGEPHPFTQSQTSPMSYFRRPSPNETCHLDCQRVFNGDIFSLGQNRTCDDELRDRILSEFLFTLMLFSNKGY